MSTVRFIKPSQPIQQGFLFGRKGGVHECVALTEFVTLGRDKSNAVLVDDIYVSQRHARIEKRTNRFILKDLQSRNGTSLNGTFITEAPLYDQDIIKIGCTEFVFSAKPLAESGNKHLTSKNPFMNEQFEKLPQVASAGIPVLILGPSGAGKELIARAVHEFSPRRHNPYVSVNCSALTESLVESELFGHLRGSFTGAMNDRKGAFETARGGTLFLDEIGDLPMTLQPKLLRALENQEIRPVGSDKDVHTDVRIVAATHQNLTLKVQRGQFRMDLFYRLQGVQITPVALKDRLEDFEDLLFTFAKQVRVRFSFAAIAELKKHSWPGNIRELKNVVSRAKALFDNQTIEAEHISRLLIGVQLSQPMELMPGSPGFSIKNVERQLILSRLSANRGNQRKTAEDLGLPKSTLHDRIRAYGIDIKNLPPDLGDPS